MAKSGVIREFSRPIGWENFRNILSKQKNITNCLSIQKKVLPLQSVFIG